MILKIDTSDLTPVRKFALWHLLKDCLSLQDDLALWFSCFDLLTFSEKSHIASLISILELEKPDSKGDSHENTD